MKRDEINYCKVWVVRGENEKTENDTPYDRFPFTVFLIFKVCISTRKTKNERFFVYRMQ